MTTHPTPKISRRTFLLALRNVAAGYAVAGLGSYFYGTHIEAGWLTVKRLTVPIRGLPASADGLRLVHLSDFHLRPLTRLEDIQKAVEIANGLKPDLIALTGDYVTERAEDAYELAPVLVNQGIRLQIGRGVLHVAGLDDGWSGAPNLAQALSNCPADTASILLMHEPDFADTFAPDPRLALQLSGHSHGGQVRLPGLGAIALPQYGRKYDYGLYRVGGMWLYTNPGIGLAFPGIRLNCRPEVTEITLTRGA